MGTESSQMESINKTVLSEDGQGCKSAIEREKDFSQDLLQGLHSLVMGVNASPESRDELVKDFKETDAFKDMVD